MNYENTEDFVKEIEKIISPIKATLLQSREELELAKSATNSLKTLSDMEKFVRTLQEEISRSQEQDKLKIAMLGIARIGEFLSAEKQRVHDKVVSTTERATVLESVVSHIESHRNALLSRKEAVERVIEGDTDPRHPEKIAVVREAERVKKSRKQDS